MEFNNNKPIYLQIADYICDKIVNSAWKEEERIPSVRELGADLQVNPNTAMRTYEYLQNKQIIYNKRGIGYFVADNATQSVAQLQREEFFDEQLPRIFKSMHTLDIPFEELQNRYNIFVQNQTK
ncbi:GntR family transcriptional regulator [Microbacter margulisiae]|uniref:DNA-binding transcriptional regulator YhcF (GntR family) n=1 Tax=Microbacter margulisiae TaxID=1350067 RepID=A0A7W5H053_9PORP|nr:GntR family transcriptional regulator [Microbacter margulisiae]MBB3186168.1 DNA-binding transcriptional regulator YhcF (GntR family) [Microbacter margulisiae]